MAEDIQSLLSRIKRTVDQSRALASRARLAALASRTMAGRANGKLRQDPTRVPADEPEVPQATG